MQDTAQYTVQLQAKNMASLRIQSKIIPYSQYHYSVCFMQNQKNPEQKTQMIFYCFCEQKQWSFNYFVLKQVQTANNQSQQLQFFQDFIIKQIKRSNPIHIKQIYCLRQKENSLNISFETRNQQVSKLSPIFENWKLARQWLELINQLRHWDQQKKNPQSHCYNNERSFTGCLFEIISSTIGPTIMTSKVKYEAKIQKLQELLIQKNQRLQQIQRQTKQFNEQIKNRDENKQLKTELDKQNKVILKYKLKNQQLKNNNKQLRTVIQKLNEKYRQQIKQLTKALECLKDNSLLQYDGRKGKFLPLQKQKKTLQQLLQEARCNIEKAQQSSFQFTLQKQIEMAIQSKTQINIYSKQRLQKITQYLKKLSVDIQDIREDIFYSNKEPYKVLLQAKQKLISLQLIRDVSQQELPKQDKGTQSRFTNKVKTFLENYLKMNCKEDGWKFKEQIQEFRRSFYTYHQKPICDLIYKQFIVLQKHLIKEFDTINHHLLKKKQSLSQYLQKQFQIKEIKISQTINKIKCLERLVVALQPSLSFNSQLNEVIDKIDEASQNAKSIFENIICYHDRSFPDYLQVAEHLVKLMTVFQKWLNHLGHKKCNFVAQCENLVIVKQEEYIKTIRNLNFNRKIAKSFSLVYDQFSQIKNLFISSKYKNMEFNKLIQDKLEEQEDKFEDIIEQIIKYQKVSLAKYRSTNLQFINKLEICFRKAEIVLSNMLTLGTADFNLRVQKFVSSMSLLFGKFVDLTKMIRKHQTQQGLVIVNGFLGLIRIFSKKQGFNQDYFGQELINYATNKQLEIFSILEQGFIRCKSELETIEEENFCNDFHDKVYRFQRFCRYFSELSYKIEEQPEKLLSKHNVIRQTVVDFRKSLQKTLRQPVQDVFVSKKQFSQAKSWLILAKQIIANKIILSFFNTQCELDLQVLLKNYSKNLSKYFQKLNIQVQKTVASHETIQVIQIYCRHSSFRYLINPFYDKNSQNKSLRFNGEEQCDQNLGKLFQKIQQQFQMDKMLVQNVSSRLKSQNYFCYQNHVQVYSQLQNIYMKYNKILNFLRSYKLNLFGNGYVLFEYCRRIITKVEDIVSLSKKSYFRKHQWLEDPQDIRLYNPEVKQKIQNLLNDLVLAIIYNSEVDKFGSSNQQQYVPTGKTQKAVQQLITLLFVQFQRITTDILQFKLGKTLRQEINMLSYLQKQIKFITGNLMSQEEIKLKNQKIFDYLIMSIKKHTSQMQKKTKISELAGKWVDSNGEFISESKLLLNELKEQKQTQAKEKYENLNGHQIKVDQYLCNYYQQENQQRKSEIVEGVSSLFDSILDNLRKTTVSQQFAQLTERKVKSIRRNLPTKVRFQFLNKITEIEKKIKAMKQQIDNEFF